MYLPENVRFVLDRLCEKGYDAYLVGGCVRDTLMGRIPNDYDITTNALPEQILECFSGYKTLTNGIKHGTVGVIFGKDVYEVTTYRIDGEYSDNRHPDKVEFSSDITDDLSRRDFTVNAIACDKTGNIVDPFGGRDDIKRRIIKCVGNPDRRFNEDALRIFRALRFSSVLNFDIESETAMSVHQNARLLENVSSERINSEFNKLLCGNRAGRILNEFRDVIDVFAKGFGKTDNIVEISDAVDRCEADFLTRLCVFVSGFLNADETERFMRFMKYDNETRKISVAVVSLAGSYFDNDRVSVRKLINKYGYDICTITNKVQYLLGNKSVEKYICFSDVLEQIMLKGECTSVAQLAFGGNDCKNALGINGIEIGRLLEKLCSAVIEEKVSNDYNSLLKYATDYLNSGENK